MTAIEIPLVNEGFETPGLDLNASFVAGVAGWSTSGGLGTTFEVPWAEASPAPQGNQYVYADSTNWTLSQTGPAILAGRRYLLSVDLFPLSTGPSTVSVALRGAGSVLAGAGNFASANPAIRQVDIPDGQWTTVTVGFHSNNVAASVGQPLEVRIAGSHFAIDNVRLSMDDAVRDFYVSASAGGGAGDGSAPEAPLAGFDALAPYLPLMPGERLLLKAGDVFQHELNIRGKGTADAPITVSRYGDGPNPILRPDDIEFGRGLVWNNASYARIDGIDVERAKIGVYLRYEWNDPGGKDVVIENAHFRDLSDPTLDPPKHNYEYAWSDAIWVGGQAWNDAEFSTRLDGLTIRNVSSLNAAHLFGTGWYYPAPYKSRVTNLLIEDSVAINNLAGAFQLFGVDGGVLRRVHSIGGGGQDTWSGTTLGFVQDARNILIEQSEFAYIDRAQSADGSGMDFEGNTDNVTFRNNVVHSNAGSGLLILGTGGRHTNLIIEDNVFYNNALDPWNSEINSEVQGSNDNHTGVIRNNSFYRGDPSINFLSPSANWSGFQISGNKNLEYEGVRTRPTRWEFDSTGDLEGWGGFNQWGAAGVIDGALAGQSTGPDPYVQSPPTWANSRELPYVWLRLKQSTGGAAQLFYLTETDGVWDQAKSVSFSTQTDGQFHDYFIDLGAVTQGSEVVTRLRVDPSVVADAQFAVEFVRFTSSRDPTQAPPAAPLPAPATMGFVSIAAADGHVLESAQNSGVGGSVSSIATTFRLGDDSQNRAYRPILSFDTSGIPDGAIVVEATLGITRIGNPTGTIPIGVADSPWGDLIVDIATGGFGATSLAASDWQALATQEGVSKFAWPAYQNNQTIYSRLDDPHPALVNATGTTQFRIRYQNDDDGDSNADYMSYASGNHPTSAYRPSLNVKYYLRSEVPGDYDLSGTVDAADFGVWQRSFGSTSGVGLLADGNRDGSVDAADYSVWRDNLGQAIAPAAAAAEVFIENAATVSAWEQLVLAAADPTLSFGPTPLNAATYAPRGVDVNSAPIADSDSRRLELLILDAAFDPADDLDQATSVSMNADESPDSSPSTNRWDPLDWLALDEF